MSLASVSETFLFYQFFFLELSGVNRRTPVNYYKFIRYFNNILTSVARSAIEM